MLAWLADGRLQVALTVRPAAKALRGLEFTELARYAMRVAVTPKHPLARGKSVSREQLAGAPLITYSRKEYPEYHAMLEALFPGKPRIAGEHDSVSSLIAAVESGHGVAVVPECLACMVGGRLKLLPLADAPPPLAVGAIWRDHDLGGLAREFIAAAKAAAGLAA
jgi:DNA-binding transcriptional LysR family regulator